MIGADALRIAVPSKGRLQEPSLDLLRRAGMRFKVSGRRLFAACSETGARIIFSNASDIPVLVSEGVVDLGIAGSDQVREKGVCVVQHRELDFGRCRLSVAVHKDAPFRTPSDLAGAVVGSKFVRLTREFLEGEGIRDAHVIEVSGALEILVLLGMVDAIVEIVETGDSLVENDLIEMVEVLAAGAVIIGNAKPRDPELVERLLRRIDGVLHADRYALLEYNCPADRVADAARITPGFSSPTVQEMHDPAWRAVKVLVLRERTHAVMDELEAIGCRAILETELRHTRL